MSELPFYVIEPGIEGLERLDIHDHTDEVSTLRDLVQHDLAALDADVMSSVPGTCVRAGSNRGGGAILFVYRVFAPPAESGIDPVVAGVLVRPTDAADHFNVSGDIAGESSGDILFECQPQCAIGWTTVIETARDIGSLLAGKTDAVISALEDVSRRE